MGIDGFHTFEIQFIFTLNYCITNQKASFTLFHDAPKADNIILILVDGCNKKL